MCNESTKHLKILLFQGNGTHCDDVDECEQSGGEHGHHCPRQHGRWAGSQASNTCDKCAAGPEGCFHEPNNISGQKHFTIENYDHDILIKYRLQF